MRKTKKRRRGSGTAGIMIIVLAFLVVMTVQICRIRSKDAEYAAKEKELQQQYEEETERSTEIDDLETYMKSSQYIEDVAKSKLGLSQKAIDKKPVYDIIQRDSRNFNFHITSFLLSYNNITFFL